MLKPTHKVILGSASPRRKELLSNIVEDFDVLSSDVDETFPDDMNAHNLAGHLSQLKWNDLSKQLDNQAIVITSDTVVILDNQAFGKPENLEEAKSMLNSLSGKQHEVMTAVTIGTQEKHFTLSDSSFVTFKELTQGEIDYYVNEHRPLDKAAAYGIQEWIGMIGITELQGSYFTVMGFPIHLVYKAIQDNWT